MATRTRTLPWRRSTPADSATARLVEVYRARHPKASVDRISQAFDLAARSHGDQRRKSGEPYVVHPVEVATIVARQGLDEVTVIGALLHDVVEDTPVTMEEVREQFGPDVAAVVDGVTKLDGVKFYSKEEHQAATMRKMLLAVAQDVRVLIIKLADRLHNMSTLAVLPREKQLRIAQETVEVFAPLAHRLGMQDVKVQLEDLAFAALHPQWYAQIDQMVSVRTPERELYLTQVIADVEQRLAELNIRCEVTGRPKHLWSIYEKMVVKGRSFDEIFDLVGIRLVVDSVRDCYAALGSIHATWKPVQGRFKDYIAMPKFNLYQSLHTTVVGPQGKPLEVQIRTREMHARAEHGIAAHWEYKDEPSRDTAWMARITDLQEESDDPDEFMANLKFDLQQDEVFVFTPKGEVVTLPAGATPVDFAYTIHTEVGHTCIGARVNGSLAPLDTPLSSGNSVEIITSRMEGAGPSKEWLDFVVTQRAANRVKAWHSRAGREDAIETGRDELARELRRQGLPVGPLLGEPLISEVAAAMNYADVDALLVAVGQGAVPAKVLTSRLARALTDTRTAAEEHLPTIVRQGARHRQAGPGVHVEGFDDIMIRLAKCCAPLPPDDIVAFETRGRGVVVHRSDCVQFAEAVYHHRHRQLEADWADDADARFATPIEIKALDRPGLMRDVSTVVVDLGLNITSATLRVGADRVADMRLDVELADAAHLESLLSALHRVHSVYGARRIVPGTDE